MHWRRAIAARIDDGRDIPMPTATKRGEHAVSVPPSMALKAAVYLAVRDAGISNSELARRLHLDEKEARRILDPRHPTKRNEHLIQSVVPSSSGSAQQS